MITIKPSQTMEPWEDYEPFGAKWYAEMMKWSKPKLIELLRDTLMKQETSDEAFMKGYNEAIKEAQQEIAKKYHPNR